MPFIAKKVPEGKRIDITQVDNPRELRKEAEFVCQLCNQPMFIKAGMIRRPYFSHKAKCSGEYETHAETVEHLFAKEYIANGLKSLKEYEGAKIFYEAPIAEIKRVADVYAVFESTGWRIAHEIQLSSITIEELEARTIDYERAGIDVVWYLGKAALTETNLDWCVRNIGVCYSLSFEICEIETPFITPDRQSNFKAKKDH